jgi:cbb3-type cytochrome oxidase maturation protein
MEILYLLVPLSVVLVFFILAGLYWAVESGQFDDLVTQGESVLEENGLNQSSIDTDQAGARTAL